VFTNAIERCSLDEIKCFHENGCPWDASTFAACTRKVDVRQMECLHEHGCPWGDNVTHAAMDSSVCLRYLIDNGCPYDKELMLRTTDTDGIIEYINALP
jgi:hypothetical protein